MLVLLLASRPVEIYLIFFAFFGIFFVMMVATMLPGTDDVPCNFIMLCFLMFFDLVAVSYMLNVSFILKSWYIPDFMRMDLLSFQID